MLAVGDPDSIARAEWVSGELVYDDFPAVLGVSVLPDDPDAAGAERQEA